MTADLPRSPAVERNREVILTVLSERFSDRQRVLEIGSGTGEHAAYFGPRMPWLHWQTSDRRQNHPGIAGWIEASGADNVALPMDIDVNDVSRIDGDFDAVFSANTAHIMSFDEVGRMFALVADALTPGGLFCLYGPFKLKGEFTSDSNAQFDQSLKSQEPSMGIRDLEALDELGLALGLRRDSLEPMPANNFLASWVNG